jgi:CheY-like chemotaxis protein
MLDHDDLKWIAATSTELNTMLQQISRYADLARQHKGEYNYIEMLGERVEVASKTAQSLFDRITSRILEGTAPKIKDPPDPSRPPEFTIVPPPAEPPPVETKAKAAPEKPSARAKSAPAEPKPAAKSNSIPADIKVLNEKGNRELILLVEDETEIAELASAMLTEEGYKVILARDGFEALRIYQQISKEIGLVILDFFLPVMDGDAVFDELKALNPDVAVVLSSGFAEQGKLGNMLAQGLRGFIPKPYTREKLLEQVRSTLDSARDSAQQG